VGDKKCYQANPGDAIAADAFESLWRSISALVRRGDAMLDAGPRQVICMGDALPCGRRPALHEPPAPGMAAAQTAASSALTAARN